MSERVAGGNNHDGDTTSTRFPCADLAADAMVRLPQVLVNVKVSDREAIARADTVWTEVDRLNSELEGQGRVLLRASGTEPLVRVMAEAPTEARAQEICDSLAELVRSDLG